MQMSKRGKNQLIFDEARGGSTFDIYAKEILKRILRP